MYLIKIVDLTSIYGMIYVKSTIKNRIIIICLIILFLSAGCINETTSNIPKTSSESLATTTTASKTAATTIAPPITNPPETIGIVYEDISVQEAINEIENNGDITILDVRTSGEFEEGYIEGAIHIPYQELEKRHTELNVPKDQAIIVYCKAGVRSKKGAQQLTELGYTNVKEMEAGIDGWTDAGGRIVKPTTTTTPAPVSETPLPTHYPKETPTPTTAPTTTPPTTTNLQLQTTTNPYILNTSNHTKKEYTQPKENC